jgi:hypothetical protein
VAMQKVTFSRIGLEPTWVEDLLGLWSSSDLERTTAHLGFPSVSPMFGRLGVADEVDSDGSYSHAEVKCLRDQLERMLHEHPDEWAAIQRAFRPWTRHAIEGGPADGEHEVLLRAAKRLSEWVDAALE